MPVEATLRTSQVHQDHPCQVRRIGSRVSGASGRFCRRLHREPEGAQGPAVKGATRRADPERGTSAGEDPDPAWGERSGPLTAGERPLPEREPTGPKGPKKRADEVGSASTPC